MKRRPKRKRKVYFKPIEGVREWNKRQKEYESFCRYAEDWWPLRPGTYERSEWLQLACREPRRNRKEQAKREREYETVDVCLNRLDWRKAMTT